MTVQEKVFFWKTAIDPEFVNLPMEEFMQAVALTKSEREEGKALIKEAKRLNIEV